MLVEEEIDKIFIKKKVTPVLDSNNENIENVAVDDDIGDILNSGILKVVDDSENNLGKDLQEITRELVQDRNVFKFGNTSSQTMVYDALLGAIADRDIYKKTVRPRYSFIKSFRYHYAVNRSALKSEQANRFKEVVGSLLGFKALLEYRSAGMMPQSDDEKKHNIMDKLKRN